MGNQAVRRSPFLSLALAFTSVLSSAWAAPPPAPAGCPSPPAQIVDLLIGGEFRGNQPIFQSSEEPGGALWIPERVLGLGEDAYVLERLNCEGEIFVRLNPALKSSFDPETVSLSITPNLELLRSSALDLDGPSLATPSDSPLLRLGYGAGASTRLDSSGLLAPRLSASLDSQLYWRGLTLQATGQGSLQNSSVQTDLDFRATYPFSTDLRSSLYWKAAGTARQRIGGVLEGQWVDLRLPDLTLDLPLEAQILVQGLGPSQLFRAPAGRLTLKNIRGGVSGGRVSVLVTDAVGTRHYEQSRSLRAGLLWPGGVTYRLEGGTESSQPFGVFTALYGLNEDIALRANVAYTASQGGNLSLTALSYLADTPFTVFGKVDFTPQGTYLPSVGGSISGRLGPLDLGFSSSVALYDLAASSVGLSVGVDNGTVGLQSSLSSDFKGKLDAKLIANVRASRDLSFAPFVRYQNNVLGFGISGNFSSGNQALSAQVQNDSAPQLGYSAQLSPSLSVGAQLSGGVIGAGLRYNDVVNAGVSATSQGDLSADVSGAVILSAEGVFISRAEAGGILIVKTGVADIPLYANGEYKGRTDAKGELAITGISESNNVQISVRPGQLPINISVGQNLREVFVAGERVNRLDWTDNFQVLSFVQFFFEGNVSVVNGSVRIGTSEYFLDDQGTLLVDKSVLGLDAQLISEDGKRSCKVRIVPVNDKVFCQP